jgi:hypothetical protein
MTSATFSEEKKDKDVVASQIYIDVPIRNSSLGFDRPGFVFEFKGVVFN